MTRFGDLAPRGDRVSFVVEHDDRDPFEVWIEGPDLELTGDALVAATLLASMARTEPVESPLPLSPGFAAGLDRLQEVFATWYDDLTPVPVTGRGRPGRGRLGRGRLGRGRPDGRRGDRVGCFFTGGVDSFHALLTNRARIDALVFVVGFDVPRTALPGLRAEVEHSLRRAADELGVPLVEIETNLHDYTDAVGSPWGTHAHGGALAAVAHVLGRSFGTLLVASTHEYRDGFPWGSHPLTDPLWGGSAVAIEHVGATADRVDKIAAIAGDETAMTHLRVCYENRDGGYNCGTCRKCLRTMIALDLAGALDRARTLPDHIDLDAVRSLPIGDRNTLARHWELVRHLRRSPDHGELLAACEENLRRADARAMRWGSGWTEAIPELFADEG